MKRLVEKTISCLLALTMMVSMVPPQAFAATDVQGNGDENSVVAGSFDVDFDNGELHDDTNDLTAFEDSSSAFSGDSYDGETDEAYVSFNEGFDMEEDIGVSLMSVSYSTISGKVVDNSGTGISGVSVLLFDVTEGEVLELCTTNASGNWSSSIGIVGNTYLVRFHRAGYEFSNNGERYVVSSSSLTTTTATGTVVNSFGTESSGTDFTYSVLNGSYISITGYGGNDTNVVIPETIDGYTVQTIAANAFKGNTTLASILISDSVTSIGANAFDGCTSLTTIGFDDSLTTIGTYAFRGCTSISDLDFPNSLTAIRSYAFSGCTGLTSVEIPDSVTSISSRAFQNCTNLSSVSLPLGWTEVPDYYSNSTTTHSSGSSYYASPFEGCSQLTSVTVPEGMTALPAYAFRKAAALKTVSLPSTLTSIKMYAFEGCSGITEIDLPTSLTGIGSYAFANCTGLKEIIIPSGITTLNTSTFQGCTGMTSVTMPSALTAIRSYAFGGCTGLTTVEIPDSVTSISSRAFQNCTNLSSVSLPLGWTEVPDYYSNSTTTYSSGSSYYASPFEGCSQLTSVTVPEGMTVLPAYAFRKAAALKTVSLPSTLTSIKMYAFEGATKLKYIEPVDGLLSIGNYAFSDCTNLETLYLPDTVTSYGTNIFQNCKKLAVECKEYSFATIYCIDADIPVEFIGESFENSFHLCLDRNSTYYVANTVGALSNGYITMNIAYGYKTSVVNTISDQSLSIRIPSDMALIEKTLKLDGNLLTGYDYSNNLLTVALSKTSGNISFSLKPTGDSTVTTYAVMNFKNNDVATKEVIGIINEKLPLLTILADDEVNSSTVAVTGIGAAEKKVTLYVDGILASTTRTNKSGTYSARVTIPSASDYATYNITAKSIDAAGNETSASKDVLYSTGAPVLQSFTMGYGGNTYDIMALGTTKPTVTFSSANQFSFDVRFSNPGEIEKVYICSTRSNVTKRMEATWNSTTNSYQANGYFDSSNKSYVPGAITVEYTQASEKIDFATGVDYTSAKYVNGASAPIKTMLNGKLKDCIEDLVSDDKQLSGVIKMVDVDTQLDFNILTDVIPSYLDPSNAGQYGYQVMEDDYGAKLYLKVAEYAEDKVRGEIIDFAHEKFTSFLIKGEHINAAAGVDSYFSFVEALGYADKLITWDNNRISISEAKQAILSSSMTSEQQAAALKKLDYASKSNNGVVAAMALQILLSAAGIAIPFPASLILPLVSMQNSAYVKDVLGQFGFLDASESEGVLFNFVWKIDPSGYVYDIETNERLEGVTTTVYWIPFEEKDEDTMPAETEFGTLWDASEWDQVNPIITDSEGRYAWDVPEGWWRVKYEKEGYATVWSDWMTVPPVQTDVNIGMTSTTVEDYAVKFVSSTTTSTTVSLTNNTLAASSVVFIIAAYNSDGKMIAVNTVDKSVASGESINLTISYKESDNAYCVKAFVVPTGTMVPLREAWSKKMAA